MERASEPSREPHEVPRVHVNSAQFHGGPFDVTLELGYRANPEDEPEIQVLVTTSWEHLKAMVKAMQGMVDGYEQQVGSVPDLTQHLREEQP